MQSELLAGWKMASELLFIIHRLHDSQIEYVTVGVKIAGRILLLLGVNIATAYSKTQCG